MPNHLAQPSWFVVTLQQAVDDHLAIAKERARQISTEALPLIDSVARMMTGGKRLRATLAWWGWQSVGGDEKASDIIQAGVALELFQTAALIHDDILDRSDTRRGMPSVHKSFEKLHRDSAWAQDAAHFGSSAGILAGDLVLGLSEELFSSVADATAYASPAREAFNTMRFEVTVGQYLDILAESDTQTPSPEQIFDRARNVLQYKSAHYSTVWPLALGAILAGADEATLRALEGFSLPLGIAFQLRDDLLGVFGDPARTGKPAGDDLIEGKRTELIALALPRLTPDQANYLNDALSDAELSPAEIPNLLELLEFSGAREKVEEQIQYESKAAVDALETLGLSTNVETGLRELANVLLHRQQ